MIEIADVFRRFADGYLSAHGATILPSHRRAIADILACRTEALGGHLHVHCLVTGGGISDDGRYWLPSRNRYLFPEAALAELVCGKLKAALARRRPDLVLPAEIWSKRWVVHSTAWGQGDEAVLRYLARYVFRVAITNNRIVGLDAAGVMLRHKHRASNRWRTVRLSGEEFMRRFLQHVLPKGPHKVRYYGLWHPTRREDAARARLLLQQCPTPAANAAPSEASGHADHEPGERAPGDDRRICPCCKVGHLTHIRRLYPKQASGP